MTGILIPADGARPLELGQFDGILDYQFAVGGWVETLSIRPIAVTIYMNEEGIPRHLPVNTRATLLWSHHVPMTGADVVVVGDAVIVGAPNEDGDDTDVPERVRELLLTQTTFRVVMRKFSSKQWFGNQLEFPDYWGAITWTKLLRDKWTRLKEIQVLLASEAEESPG